MRYKKTDKILEGGSAYTPVCPKKGEHKLLPTPQAHMPSFPP